MSLDQELSEDEIQRLRVRFESILVTTETLAGLRDAGEPLKKLADLMAREAFGFVRNNGWRPQRTVARIVDAAGGRITVGPYAMISGFEHLEDSTPVLVHECDEDAQGGWLTDTYTVHHE